MIDYPAHDLIRELHAAFNSSFADKVGVSIARTSGDKIATYADILAEFDGALQRISELEGVNQWRDMESAPKGTIILGCFHNGIRLAVSSIHCPSYSHAWLLSEIDAGTCDATVKPIYWMPLPQPKSES